LKVGRSAGQYGSWRDLARFAAIHDTHWNGREVPAAFALADQCF
jgi:hypothetical protein